MKKLLLMIAMVAALQPAFAQSYRVNRTEEKSRKVKIKDEKFGKNIISFSPVHIVAPDMENGDPDVTVAIAYERIFNNGLISVKLPVHLCLTQPYYYIMPAIKLYPKKQGVAKYAIGPQIMIGMGQREYEQYLTGTGGIVYSRWVKETYNQFGFYLNNSVNFTVAKALYIALDFGFGIKYYDSGAKQANNPNYTGLSPFSDSGISPAFQLGFNMGYRF